jgi:Collagenase and related proteases
MEDKKPELLSPAGDMERLHMAVAYGADAVYLAGHTFGMRANAGNFSEEELTAAVAHCHERGVQVYVTLNTMPRHEEIVRLPAFLEFLETAKVDGVILADVGVLSLAKRHAPGVPVHVSTQASIVNATTATAWHDLGASRVILAREMSLSEITTLRAHTPRALEIECFVHGAMCVSYSGRCLLSGYMTGRDSNRGACAQPCRYEYALVEEKRPGEYFPIIEEAGQTYILNAKDMCMIDHVPELLAAGIDSLKIEGRAKSAYYAAVVTKAYRAAIDAALAGKPLAEDLRHEVFKVSHRHYGTGFYFDEAKQYYEDSRYEREFQVVAVVERCGADGMALLSLRNKFAVGEELELLMPQGRAVTLTASVMRNDKGAEVDEIRKPKELFMMQLPQCVPPLSMLRRRG